MKHLCHCSLLILLCSCFVKSNAQVPVSLWDNAGNTKHALQKKGRNVYKQVKQLRTHLEQWGMDSAFNYGVAVGPKLNSNGWTAFIVYQKRISRRQTAIWQFSFSEVKHEKEIKQQRENTAYPALGNSSPFIFGKINNVYQLQLGYGREYLLLPGVMEGNLSLGLRVQAGFSLASLKPYYLKLIYEVHNPDERLWVQEEKYSEANAEKFLNTGYILGKSKWKEGFNGTKYIPGFYFDGAVTLEALKNNSFIKTVSLGANLSIHTEALELVAGNKAFPWATNLYVSLALGKKWSNRSKR